ncbi:MAG: redoxin family protein [Gemmatales bacterium]
MKAYRYVFIVMICSLPTLVAQDSWPTALLEMSDGRASSLQSLSKEKPTVVVFVTPECPISNSYMPVLCELKTQACSKDVTWLVIYPEAIGRNRIATHSKEYNLPGQALHDATGAMARSLAVSMIPEVVVLTRSGKVVYRGRIDDRYTRRGGGAREPRQHDLKDVLIALQQGKLPARSYQQPVGCPFPEVEKDVPANGAITYTRDVAPILNHRCVGCHRSGGAGPFALTDYQQAKSWAADVVALTASGQMPPWKPVPGHGEFQNDRRMPDKEKKILADWLAANCPQGDAKDLPPVPVFPSEWQRGVPDLILQPAEVYHLSASGPDEYRCFVLPTNFSEDKYISSFEILPGNRQVVHHVLSFIDTSGVSEKLDQADPSPGYSTVAGFPGFIPQGGLGGWAPGNTGRPLPDGTARLLPKGARIVMQVHYHKSGKTEVDQTRLGLYFSKAPVERAAFDLMVVPLRARFGGMRITPGASNYECKASLTLADDYFFYSTTPHMHLLGKDMEVTATLPDGTIMPIIFVNDWDFNWQESYRFKEPLALPKGTRLDLVAHFDNSSNNPRNPHDPPKLVTWGEQTNDEMCIAFFEVSFQRKAASQDELRPPGPGFLFRQQLGLKKK